MAGAGRGGSHVRGGGIGAGWDRADDAPIEPHKPDWKRRLLIFGLGGLSWVATFVGMLELIEANVGDLAFSHRIIIGFSVAMLMVMVVWLLDQIFSDIGWATRLLYVGGYVFLTLISVGFGFGFYWKVLESRGEATRSAESAVGQVQTALHAGVTRLEQLQGTLDTLTTVSAGKAKLERDQGTSCPNSRPGDGPRRQLRDDDASRFKFAADFVRGRIGGLKTELSSLNGALTKIGSNDSSLVDAASGTRNDYMRGLNRRLDMTVTGFNAFRSDPQLRQIRADLADRSDRVSFPDSRGGTFQCPDAQLSAALRGVVRAIDELPSLEKPKIAAVEGSEAVIEAFRRLSASLFGLMSFKMPPSAEELRELQKRAVQSVEASPATQARLNAMAAEAGLSKRDYIPLAIALFVDLCLLLVSIKRPARGLDRLVPKMRAAEQGPVIQILSRFNEIHRDREIRENFEVFRHVVFDFHGDYYAAVPLNAPYRPNVRNGRQMQGYGVAEAEELLQEAHLLANLFASFEKERIFTRVMSPLLTTSAVQKRLRRQGSKFANAEAFRLYRFRDGAWSEIILGAVMGAARRVEAEKRRHQAERDPFELGGLPPDGPSSPPGDGGRRTGDGRETTGGGRHWARDAFRRHGRGAQAQATSEPDGQRTKAGFSPRIVATETESHPHVPGRQEPRTSPKAGRENVVFHPAVGRGAVQPKTPGWEYVPTSAGTRAAERPDVVSITTPEQSYAPHRSARETEALVEVPGVHAAPEIAPVAQTAGDAMATESGHAAESHDADPATPPPLPLGKTVGSDRAVRASVRPLSDGGEPPKANPATEQADRSAEAPGAEPGPNHPDTIESLRAIAVRFGPQTGET